MTGINEKLSLDEFIEHLCSSQYGPEMGRVAFKFVRNMLKGIHRTRSVNLTDIAKQLNEGIRLHATHKRLSRNLDNPDLARQLSDRLLKVGASSVRTDTRLIVNMYELNKKYARKVEFLPEPDADAKSGFRVCEIIASDHGSDFFTPLLTTVWSDHVPGFVSDANEVVNAIRRVLNATGNKGIVINDHFALGGVDVLQSILEQPEINFIQLMTDLETEVLYKNESCSLQSLVESVETPYGRTFFKLVPEGIAGNSKNTDMDLFMHVGALAIKMPHCDRNLRLIALKSKNRVVGEILSPIITSETNLRSRKSLMGLVESFLSVQDALASHRMVRDSFNPASFRVLTFHRLQFLMTLLQGVLQYEVCNRGKVPVSDHRFSTKPHSGDVARTYMLPGQLL